MVPAKKQARASSRCSTQNQTLSATSESCPCRSRSKSEGVDLGKMDRELEANEENQDGAQYGNNHAGGMIAFVGGAGKHLGKAVPEDRSDNATSLVAAGVALLAG
jgi:hypothetical protein